MTLPLTGLQVLALEQAVAAPLCTRHLADLGADVIKIERPGEGDFARAYDTAVHGQASWFVWLNRGKQSLTLDLKDRRGQAIAQQLVERADVVVQNFAPGAVDRLGLGIDQLRERWPGLIACSITGYGEDGPYRDRKAYDLLLQAEAGVLAITGTPEGPAKSGVSLVDLSSGMYALSAILAALYRRRESGEGATIRISLFDSVMEWMSAPALQAAGGMPPARAGARHATIVPYGPYRTGDGGHVMLAVQNDREWARLCAEVLDRPAWTGDPRFARNAARFANRAVLEPLIEDALAAYTVAEAEARLDAAAIAYSRMNGVDGLFDHPQVRDRDRRRAVETPAGPIDLLRAPFNIDGVAERPAAVPALGEHTDAILAGLGYDAAAIAALHADGVV